MYHFNTSTGFSHLKWAIYGCRGNSSTSLFEYTFQVPQLYDLGEASRLNIGTDCTVEIYIIFHHGNKTRRGYVVI